MELCICKKKTIYLSRVCTWGNADTYRAGVDNLLLKRSRDLRIRDHCHVGIQTPSMQWNINQRWIHKHCELCVETWTKPGWVWSHVIYVLKHEPNTGERFRFLSGNRYLTSWGLVFVHRCVLLSMECGNVSTQGACHIPILVLTFWQISTQFDCSREWGLGVRSGQLWD